MMKKLVVVAIVLLALAPAVAAQTAATFTGKWEGTFKMQRPDGTEGDPRPVVFDLTQKGKVLTGTAGPADTVEGRKGRRQRRHGHVRGPAARRPAVQVHADDRQGTPAGRHGRRARRRRAGPRQGRRRESEVAM